MCVWQTVKLFQRVAAVLSVVRWARRWVAGLPVVDFVRFGDLSVVQWVCLMDAVVYVFSVPLRIRTRPAMLVVGPGRR